MKTIKAIFLAVAMIFGIGITTQTTQAANLGGYNVGEYVYEDDEVITNEQVAQLNRINQKINRGASPQELYLVLIGDSDSWKTFTDSYSNPDAADISESKGIPGLIIGKTGPAVIGSQKYYDMEMDDGDDLDNTNNYIIFNFKTNRFYFNPSEWAQFYLTDLTVWKLMMGLNSQLKSGNSNEQMDAIMKFAEKVQPKLENVSQTSKLLKALDYRQLMTRIKGTLAVIGFIVGITLIIFWKKKHPGSGNSGGGSELGNSDYDAGFDEGYYMGSNDPFM